MNAGQSSNLKDGENMELGGKITSQLGESWEELNPTEFYEAMSEIIPLGNLLDYQEASLKGSIAYILESNKGKPIEAKVLLDKLLEDIRYLKWDRMCLYQHMRQYSREYQVEWIMRNFINRHDPQMKQVYRTLNPPLEPLSEKEWDGVKDLLVRRGDGDLFDRSSGKLWDEKSVRDIIKVYHLSPRSAVDDDHRSAIDLVSFYTHLYTKLHIGLGVVTQLQRELKGFGWKDNMVLLDPMVEYTTQWLFRNGYCTETEIPVLSKQMKIFS